GGFAFLGPTIDRFVTEDYWNDFRTTPEARLTYSAGELARHEKPIQFGLPGNAPAAEMERALTWLEGGGLLAVPPMIWRRGTTSWQPWETIAGFAPPPPEPPVDWQAEAARWRGSFETLAGEVERWTSDDAAGAQMRADRLHELAEVR